MKRVVNWPSSKTLTTIGTPIWRGDRKSTRLNSSHGYISYAVFCLKKKNKEKIYSCNADHQSRNSNLSGLVRPSVYVTKPIILAFTIVDFVCVAFAAATCYCWHRAR